jgi:DNA polymerase III alpha subunit
MSLTKSKQTKQTTLFDFFGNQNIQKRKTKEEIRDEKKEVENKREQFDYELFLNNSTSILSNLNLFIQSNQAEESFKIFEHNMVKILCGTFVREIPDDPEYYNRLNYEFTLIERNDFFLVFLQVREILKLTHDYPHIIRGSAGSSLVCFLMGITNINPILENIPLTRFMHEKRLDIPDIDLDIPAHAREIIFERIYNKWEGRVARISNHIRFKEKSAIKEAIRRKGYHKFIPKEFDLKDIFDDPSIQYEVMEEAGNLIGEFRCHSLHCGGIVIFQDKIPDEYYLKDYVINKSKKEKSPTGAQLNLNKDEAEDYGLIKIDVLSNRGLSLLWEISSLPIENYPRNDPNVYSIFTQGNNLGIVFGESRGMRKIFMEMKPNSIEDLACALALIRPAASKNGQKFTFLRDYYQLGVVKRNEFIIYDDDAIQFIARMLEISHSEADIYRKAFAKNRYYVKKEFKRLFDEKQKENMTVEKRQLIFEQLECLQEYSFCKSHAISYAKLILALAYQKYYHPQQFWEAALKHCHSSYRTWVHFREAKKAGVDLKKYAKNKFKNQVIKSFTKIQQYFMMGYWEDEGFLPGMYFENLGLRTVIENENKRKKEKAQSFEEEESDISDSESEEEEDDKNKNKKAKVLPYIRFRGIIATYKLFQADRYVRKREENKESKKNKFITFITLGYNDGEYIDLAVWGMFKLSKVHCISGEGYLEDSNTCPWIRVKKIRFERISEEE